ncbi:MG2 domain-containing protein [Piscinibacter sp. XHJ-5]|uniref:alpha-2-macroglobulin family protein n=1 Tax=Piscinibacter sp. XHJ-5 TaxID=3037797 RepID=UPI002452A38B|nr:MG2 domain-containing protein [Piscinibacter sp. XHJ-5]
MQPAFLLRAAGAIALSSTAALAAAATMATFSPQGEVAQVRQARASFSQAMVRFGDPRLPSPFDIACANPTPLTGSARWVDDRTWVYDFTRDVPAGVRCEFKLKPGIKALNGDAVTGATEFRFGTGGPAIVRAYPQPGDHSTVEEEQVFVLLLNGPATPASIEKNGYCEVSGIGERVGLKVISGPVREAILKAVNLVPQQARAVTVQCARPLPSDARVEVAWGAGIATPSGVATTAERRLGYRVRKPFAASFTCERVNSRADCLPIRPLRVEFSSPVPRRFAERIVLVAPDGARKPVMEQGRGENAEQLISFGEGTLRKFLYIFRRSPGEASADPADSGVSAVQFSAPLPENAKLRIELPQDLRDDAGRALGNADAFPLETRTAAAPALVKFPAATFGVLELNAEPTLPVTLRQVEADLKTQAVSLAPGAVRDLRVADDAAVIEWLARVKRYDENQLPRAEVERELGIRLPAPARSAKGRDDDEGDLVQTRSLSLLSRDRAARRLSLPLAGATEPRPFEVVGIPLPQAGFHVVEIESPRLGAALLGRNSPLYVRTSVLVTNLGVHFKWGAVNSVVWVTTLDTARPVADAQLQISDCRGDVVWKGRSDANGHALVAQELPRLPWNHCHGRDGGDSGREAGYFVSARSTDAAGHADMAFVWSTWSEGIEAWRFHIDTSAQGIASQNRFHSVLDRSLLRAGQKVSMKHHARRELMSGLALVEPSELPAELRIVHEGSGQKFTQPLQWRAGRHAESSFEIPAAARLGVYRVSLANARESHQTASFRVEEFRLPVLAGRIVPPKGALVQPRDLALGLQVDYTNGGGASGLPVRVSAQMRDADVGALVHAERYPGFRFEPPRDPRDPNARSPFSEDYVDEDDESRSTGARDEGAQLVANKLALTLDKNGAGTITLPGLPALRKPRELLVQATYADPNGEIQTLSQTLPAWPSGLVLGVRADSWVSVKQKLATQVVVLDTAGKPAARVDVKLRAVAHKTSSVRRRLVGGFYAYDNRNAAEDLGQVCAGTSDARGLVLCDVALKSPGQVELVAEAQDAAGHAARAAASVWVTQQGEVWFGGDNQDRMDVIPEQRSYEPGQTAKLQVRSPFRHATALVAIERNGILETRTVELHGRDPTIELPVKAEWAPNVYVSVLAVRGRLREVPWYSLFTWGWRSPSQWWRAYRDEGQVHQPPTAMVDLSKPAFRYGIAEIEVGIAGHRLQVEVTPDKTSYPIRSTSRVRVKVSLPGGQPAPAGTEVALAAVDEALLELMPNDSWDLLKAMIRKRGYGVETATAQMQIIGKRHYGKKAAPAGGGGGQFPTRELFDTLLLWNPRVLLDARGEAQVDVPLNDALTSFRIVAIADVVQGGDAALFGTGRATIRTTQDLQIASGVPPLVREGDRYRAMFTLRNSTPAAVEATLTAQVGTTALAPQKVRIAANAAAEAGWDVDVPFDARQLEWTVAAEAGANRDRMKIQQAVREAIPVRVQQATLSQLDGTAAMPVAPPASAVATAQGVLRGGVEVSLRPRLGDGLQGVREYFERYPWSCLEQRASVALGLRDAERWRSVASQLPLYLDEDGLANYFPPATGWRSTGSDTLTAYLLSASDEARRLGHDFAIPEDTRSKMERGLIAFVEGRVKRDFWVPAFLRNGDLEVRKLAALEALSRSGKVRPRLLDSIQVLPHQWPTGAVIDWLMVLERSKEIPERDRRIAEAEQILRARLDVQGSRLGFSTERDDSWWWLMVNGDVNSTRMVLGVLDRAAWRDDLPRLVAGTLQRQQFGRWSTTTANVWGSLAMEAFSRRFEREPVSGSTRVGFESAAAPQALDWSRSPGGATLPLGWPAGFAVGGAKADAVIQVQHQGAGKPWLALASKAAVPVTAPIASGYRITRTVTPVEHKATGAWSRGDVLRVRLDIDAQADMTWVVIADPVPAGATLLGSGLGRDDKLNRSGEKQDGRAWLAYEERGFEGFRAYYRYLPKGAFSVEYTMRLNNPGRFGLPATRVEAMYAPEMFGEAPNAAMVVQP